MLSVLGTLPAECFTTVVVAPHPGSRRDGRQWGMAMKVLFRAAVELFMRSLEAEVGLGFS